MKNRLSRRRLDSRGLAGKGAYLLREARFHPRGRVGLYGADLRGFINCLIERRESLCGAIPILAREELLYRADRVAHCLLAACIKNVALFCSALSFLGR